MQQPNPRTNSIYINSSSYFNDQLFILSNESEAHIILNLEIFKYGKYIILITKNRTHGRSHSSSPAQSTVSCFLNVFKINFTLNICRIRLCGLGWATQGRELIRAFPGGGNENYWISLHMCLVYAYCVCRWICACF